MPELNDLFSLVTLMLVVIFGLFVRARLVNVENFAKNAMEFINNQNKRSVTLKKMAEVEASLTELTDAYDALMASHKKLRSRITMRTNREAKQNGLDSNVDMQSSADKNALRLAAKQSGLLR